MLDKIAHLKLLDPCKGGLEIMVHPAVSDISTWRHRDADEATPDQALVRLIAVGDKRSMRVLVARHAAFVHRFILRLVGDASLAEDIFGEVFLEVWRRAQGFQGFAENSGVTPWSLAIARQEAIEALRCRSHA